jgi:glutamate carboxypeptidase
MPSAGRWPSSVPPSSGSPHAPVDGERQLGDLVIGRLTGSGPRLLLIGHMDTVFEPGTAALRPFHTDGERATGPGVSDMKGGLLAGVHALAALHGMGRRPSVTFVANPDEEIGSPSARSTSAASSPSTTPPWCWSAPGPTATSSAPARGSPTSRSPITGRAAHAGVEPEKGRSAIVEAARQVLALHALNGRWPSVTVNAGVIDGGNAAERGGGIVPDGARPARREHR